MKLANVFAGGAAELAGLSAGDTLVAFDGLKATADRIDAYARDARPGDRIAVHAFRRDELIEATLELAAAPEDTAWLALDPDAPADAVARRERWLS
jgi:predicted metalloprotease with PDZ domain